MNDVVVRYNGEQVSVPWEVADFLEAYRKREQAEAKRDQRHLSKREFETVSSRGAFPIRPVEDTVLKNLLLEKLRAAIEKLSEDEQRLIDLRYSEELTLEEIGKVFALSKMAVSKRLKKLHEKLRSSVT